MKKIKYELLKIKDIKLIAIIFSFVILEIFLLAGDSFNSHAINRENYLFYSNFLKQVETIPVEKAEELIKSEISYYESIEGNEQISILEEILSERKHISNFANRVETIIQNGKKMSVLSIFQTNNNYSSNNIQKTINDYQALEGITVKLQDRTGFLNFIFSWKEDLFILFSSVLCLLSLLFYDRNQFTEDLINSQKTSQVERAKIKLAVSLIIFISLFILFYSISFIYQYFMYGFHGGFDFVQSSVKFIGYVRPLNFIQILFVILIYKFILLYVCVGLTVLISEWTKDIKRGFSIIIFCVILEALFYFLIPNQSIFNVLRQFNLFNFFNYQSSLFIYQNLNFFNIPLSLDACIFLFLILSASLITFLLFKTISKKNKESIFAIKRKQNLYQIFSKHIKVYNLYFQELYYVLVNRKLILFIIIAFLFNIYCIKKTNRIIGLDTYYYCLYTEQYQGKYDAANDTALHHLREQINLALDVLKELEIKFVNGDISSEQYYSKRLEFSELDAQSRGLYKVEQQLNSILSEEKYVFNKNGWSYLLQKDVDSLGINYANVDLLIIIIGMIISTEMFYRVQGKRGKMELFNATIMAKAHLNIKQRCNCLVLILIGSSFFLKYWYTSCEILGLAGGDAHFNNLVQFEPTIFKNFSLTCMNILFLIHRYLLLYFALQIMMWFAKKNDSIRFILIASMLFVCPLIGTICQLNLLHFFSISNLFINVRSMITYFQWDILLVTLFLISAAYKRRREK